MQQSIVHVALIVREYDEAIEFFTMKLNFEADTNQYSTPMAITKRTA